MEHVGVTAMAEEAAALYFVVHAANTYRQKILIPSGDLCHGSVTKDQPVEIVQRDGTAIPAVQHGDPIVGTTQSQKTVSADEVGYREVVMRFRDMAPQAITSWTIIRAPGPRPVPAPAAWYADPFARHEKRYWSGLVWTGHVSDQGASGYDPLPGAVDRALAAFEQVVASGRLGPLGERSLDLTGATSEAIAAVLERWTRVIEAPRERDDLLTPLARRAELYLRLGMEADHDRDMLRWAAIYEGIVTYAPSARPGAGLFGVGAVAAFGAVGGEFAAAFAAGVEHEWKVIGANTRKQMMQNGRAIAVGYCRTCGSVSWLDLDLRCARCHHRCEDASTAPRSEAQDAWEAVAARHAA